MGAFLKKIKPFLISVVIIAIGILMIACLSYDGEDVKLYDASVSGKFGPIIGEPYEITTDMYSCEAIDNITNVSNKMFPQELNCQKSLYFEFQEEHYSDMGNVNRAEIYLECNYSEDFFNNEIDRLSKLYCHYNSKDKYSVYTETLFALPAFVISYNYDSQFEYALIDYDNLRIIYIYLFAINDYRDNSLSNIVFNKDYAPTKKLKDSDFDKSLNHSGKYSIYYISSSGRY